MVVLFVAAINVFTVSSTGTRTELDTDLLNRMGHDCIDANGKHRLEFISGSAEAGWQLQWLDGAFYEWVEQTLGMSCVAERIVTGNTSRIYIWDSEVRPHTRGPLYEIRWIKNLPSHEKWNLLSANRSGVWRLDRRRDQW